MHSGQHFWQDYAACRQLPKTFAVDFFPKDRRSAQAKLAKQFCGVCPMRLACLDWALRYEEAGIWGGTDDTEREWLRNPTTIMETADAEG